MPFGLATYIYDLPFKVSSIGVTIADQSNTTSNDWATASVFHVGERSITVESMTAVFGSTNYYTSQYIEIGVYESTGTHGADLAPGVLIGSFDTSVIYSSNDKFSIDLASFSSFELQSNTDYLLEWNAQPGASSLGRKKEPEHPIR